MIYIVNYALKMGVTFVFMVYLFHVIIEILTILYVYFKLTCMCLVQHFGLAKVLFCVKAKRDLFSLHCSSSLTTTV